MLNLNLIYIIGSIGALLFMGNYVPDVYKALKTKEIKGVIVVSQILLLVALICANITNYYFKNWPFVVNDSVSIILVSIILINRKKKLVD